MAAKIGLTGGIGSGKTTGANYFVDVGVQVINADQIARRISIPGTPQFEEIRQQFGDEVLDSSGDLDRKRLAEIIFSSSQKRKLLESILHPPIRVEMYALAAQNKQPYCILDIPLLFESEQYREMDRVVVVTCPREVRIERLQQQRNMYGDEIARVMNSQASDGQRLAIADDVIENGGTKEYMQPQVERLHKRYLELFS